MARAGLEPGTAGLRVRRADHLATLPPYLLTIELDSVLISLLHTLCDIQEQLYYTLLSLNHFLWLLKVFRWGQYSAI